MNTPRDPTSEPQPRPMEGRFEREILPLSIPTADGGTSEHTVDETVRRSTTVEGLAGLASSFRDEQLAARYP